MADLDLSGYDKAVAAAPKEEKQLDLSHFDKAMADNSEPGIGEALLRGAANGATFGAEPVIAGGVDALRKAVMNGEISLDDLAKNYKSGRDEANANNDAAANAHGIATFAGNVLGSLPLALMTGGGSELAEATTGAKALNALTTGAKFGAANAVGSGISKGKDVGDIAKDALKDAGVGAVTGGVLHGVIGGGKALVNKLSDTDLVSSPVEGFKAGLSGTDLITNSGKESAQNATEEAGTKLANAVSDEKDEVGKKLGGLYSAASDSKFNVQDLHDKLLDAIDEAQNTPGDDAKASARKLQSLYDDMFKGTQKTLQGEMSEFTPAQQIPATKSGMEKAQEMLAKMQANDASQGVEAKYSIVPSKDGKFLSVLRHSDENIDATERANPILDEEGNETGQYDLQPGTDNFKTSQKSTTIPNVPGSEAQLVPSQPGSLVQASPIQIRTGGANPQSMDLASLRRLQGVLTEMGGVAKGSTPLPNSQAAASARSIAQGLGNVVDTSNPEIGATKDQYATLIGALKNLGLDNSHFQTDPITGVESLTPNAESKFSSLIQRSARDGETASGSKAAATLDDVIGKLAQVNYQKAAPLAQETAEAGKNFDLMQKIQGLNFTNPSTFLKSGGAWAGNALGQGVKAGVDAVKGVGSEVANSFPAKVISSAIQPLSNTALAQGAKSMLATGTPTAMKLASELSTAMQQTGTQRNATMFALMQQPGYRGLLKEHLGLGDDTQQ